MTDPIMRVRATLFVLLKAVRLKLKGREGILRALDVDEKEARAKPAMPDDKKFESPPVVLDIGACAPRVVTQTNRRENDRTTFREIHAHDVEAIGK